MFDILAHCFFVGIVQCLRARDSVFCVCTLCFFFTPIRLEGSIFGGQYIFGGPYIFGGLSLYLEGHIYLEGYIYMEGYIFLRALFVRLRPGPS